MSDPTPEERARIVAAHVKPNPEPSEEEKLVLLYCQAVLDTTKTIRPIFDERPGQRNHLTPLAAKCMIEKLRRLSKEELLHLIGCMAAVDIVGHL
jgi:hypothetical protein